MSHELYFHVFCFNYIFMINFFINGLLHFLYGSPPVVKTIPVRRQARGPHTGGHLATSEVDVEMILSYKLFERFFVVVSASITT